MTSAKPRGRSRWWQWPLKSPWAVRVSLEATWSSCVSVALSCCRFNVSLHVARLSTFCRLRNSRCQHVFTLPTTLTDLTIHPHNCFLSSQPHFPIALERRQRTHPIVIFWIQSVLSTHCHSPQPPTDTLYLARPSARSTLPLPCVLSTDS
jgi:hypothetical protein